jgi:hypothetical protein
VGRSPGKSRILWRWVLRWIDCLCISNQPACHLILRRLQHSAMTAPSTHTLLSKHQAGLITDHKECQVLATSFQLDN